MYIYTNTNFFCWAYFNLLIKISFLEVLQSSFFLLITLYPHAIQVNSYSYGIKFFLIKFKLFRAYLWIILSSVRFFYQVLLASIKFDSFIYWLFSSKDSFVDFDRFWLYLLGKYLIRFERKGMVYDFSYCIKFLSRICTISFRKKTFLISAVLTNCPNQNWGLCICLLWLRFEKLIFWFNFLLALIGSIFVELWTVSSYCLMMVDNWDNQSACLFSITGFFHKLRIVLLNLSAIDVPLSE